MSLQFRKGADAERLTITPLSGEPIWTTDTTKLYVGDGVTPGGVLVTGGGGGSGGTSTYATLTVTNYLSIGTSTNYSATGLLYAHNNTEMHIRAPSDNTIYVDANNVIFQADAVIPGGLVLNRIENDSVGFVILNAGLNQIGSEYINTLTNLTVTGSGTFEQVISGGVVNKGYTNTSASGDVTVPVASFDSAQFGSAKYIVQINRPNGGYRETVELLVMTDDTDVYVNEYGKIANQTLAGEFIVGITGGIVSIEYHWTITPDPTGPLIAKVSATLIPQ